MEIEKELEKVRFNMMDLATEAKDRLHEPFGNQQAMRVWAHLSAIENALRTISWALKRTINPHTD